MRLVANTLVIGFALVGVVATIQELRGQTAQAGSPLEGATVGHIGIIVRDINATAKQFQEVFGVTVPPAMDYGPLRFHTDVPGSENSKVKVVMFKLAGLSVELIEPVQGPGPQKDFLDRFGPGLQHIAFGGVKDNLAAIRFLESRGGKRTQVNYVDMKDLLGFTAEIGTNRDTPR